MEIMLTGKRLPADEAQRLGLVATIAEDVMASAMQLADKIAAKASLAIRALLATLRHNEYMPLSLAFASMREEVPQYARMRESADAQEGPRAFVDRRSPLWRGC